MTNEQSSMVDGVTCDRHARRGGLALRVLDIRTGIEGLGYRVVS